MAAIDKRVGKKGISWRARVTVKGQPLQVKTYRRKTDAVEWAAKTEAVLRDGQALPGREARRRTVADLIERYRLEIVPAYSRREQAQRLGKLAWWQTQLGHFLHWCKENDGWLYAWESFFESGYLVDLRVGIEQWAVLQRAHREHEEAMLREAAAS
jgi:hypothetical protein